MENILEEWSSLSGDLASKFTFPEADTSVQSVDRTVEPRGIKVRVYMPSIVPGSQDIPLAVYMHGGGWAMGNLDSEDFQPRLIAKRSGLVVVSVDYRLAPEHRFPLPLNDCVDAIEWAVTNARSLGATTDDVIIIGASAGANLAIASSLQLIDRGRGSILRGLVAVVPVTVHPKFVPLEYSSLYRSFEEEADCPIDTADAMAGPGGFWGLLMAFHISNELTNIDLRYVCQRSFQSICFGPAT